MKTHQFYNDNATKLAEQYLSKTFEQVHRSWSPFLPSIIENPNARILDLGAGSGRDVKYLAQLATKTHQTNNNIQIFAVEPAQELAVIGQKTTDALNVKWIDDSLPALSKVSKQEVSFDLILLSAVWMHMNAEEQSDALNTLSKLVSHGGLIVITLRIGEFTDGRIAHKINETDLIAQANSLNLDVILNENSADALDRSDVTWKTLVFKWKH
ncbi:class I SAM-dependent methyltransferase [Psychrosphaera aquimarina]|uniref:Class I SAM-dependent methyltransferase n=1 Tax=Psychrosphaera aquimarina TaxID=2044854 RepID=A0ABU3R2B5_9GAMM|nr:class I SAM-dependent methyltransferase [Psychrosphaera aquimarina]MDU0113808.1 class I SAM-dependent methyltransferase [Psychrosphaera aquimarina]